MHERNNPRSENLRKVFITAVPLMLVIIQVVIERQIDAITLGLVAIALLPWLYTLIESAELPGGFTIRFRLRQLQGEQVRQGLELDTLKFLVTHFVSSDELRHLEKLADAREFYFEWHDDFRNEMWRLWRHRLIKAKHGDLTLKEMESKQRGSDAREYFELTEAGEEYLRLARQVGSTGEKRAEL